MMIDLSVLMPILLSLRGSIDLFIRETGNIFIKVKYLRAGQIILIY